MPELLIELFSEEIPARMQARAEADFARLLLDALKAAGLDAQDLRTASGPRRLAFSAQLPARSADLREAKKGPRVGAPDKAIDGFLRAAGLSSIDQAQVIKDPKGDFYEAVIERQGRATLDIVAEALPAVIQAFPWPKSMRTGTGEMRWVRPLLCILCAFNGKAVPVAVEGVEAGLLTSGHRFHAPAPFKATTFEAYTDGLLKARVIADREQRKTAILNGAREACEKRGLSLVEDAGLLEETAGLVEWPVIVLGDMDKAFLDLPAEVIRLTMRTHQKYFAVRDAKTGALAPHFITIANIEATDGGMAIAKGNARVLSARLNDARFFWAKDGEVPLYTDERREKLKQIVFHAKLGSVWDKVERVRALAKDLAPMVWASISASNSPPPFTGEVVAERPEGAYTSLEAFLAAIDQAALNCKMDLVTETVGEFPELQGQIGRQLYLSALLPPAGEGKLSIAAAIEDHYRPLGPSDRVPTDPVAVTLALADKLDTLAGFWAIDEKPTGSSDPYALRRAALGVVRIVLTNGVRLNEPSSPNDGRGGVLLRAFSPFARSYRQQVEFDMPEAAPRKAADLLAFLADRLKVQLREQGKRHDLVDAVFGLGDDDLVRIVMRVEALDAFLKTEDGKNLLAGYKRAANILAAEAKKGDGVSPGWAMDQAAQAEPAEFALREALSAALPKARAGVQSEDFAAAMKALAGLRAPVDAFFETVMVNAADQTIRRNRLLLLSTFCEGCAAVADFSKIEG